MAKCNQKNCHNPGAFRFTWPGQDEQEICSEHVEKLRSVAAVMGFHVQIRPIENERQRMVVDHIIVKCKGCGGERTFYPDANLIGAEGLLEWMKTKIPEGCDCGSRVADIKAHVKNAAALGFL